MHIPFAFGIGWTELLVFGGIALLLFGTRLPTLARSFGQSVVEFKKGMKDIEAEVKAEAQDDGDKGKAKDAQE